MKRDWKATMTVRLWALRNVFLLWLIGPRILEVNDRRWSDTKQYHVVRLIG